MKRLGLLLLPLAAYAAAPAADWSPNLTLLAAWNSNISNGEAVWDRVGALQFGADALGSSQHVLSPSDTVRATVHFGADWFPRFDALDRGAVGGRVDWQHTFGRDALAPVFILEASGDGVATGESARRGATGALTFNLRKRFGEVWRMALIERFDQYAAQRSVFDGHGNETSVEVARDINEVTRLVLTGRWRDGEVVTYAQYHRPDLAAIADASASLNTFHQNMTAYATHAQTLAGKLALIHAASHEAAVVLAFEYARTNRTGLRFANQIISLSLVRQF